MNRIGAGVWQLAVRGATLVAALIFGCVFAAFIYKIVMRYAAGDAVAWADEISVVLFVWIIFWANAFVVEDRRQITFDLVVRLLSPPWRRAAAIARLVIIGKMLRHSQPATTARYAYLADDPVRAASEAVGRYIASAMDGNTSAEVIAFGRSRKVRR